MRPLTAIGHCCCIIAVVLGGASWALATKAFALVAAAMDDAQSSMCHHLSPRTAHELQLKM
jgi:hypothetical protein